MCGNSGSRIVWEFRSPLFSLNEYDTEKVIDVQSSFAPSGVIPMVLRFVFFVWTLLSLLGNVLIFPEENWFIFMGYLTHWTWVMSIVYQLVSFMTVLPYFQARLFSINDNVPWLIKTQWILYSIAAPGEIIVILLYWTLDYNGGPVDYFNVFKHLIVGLLVLIDGLFIGVIPVRLKHFFVLVLYSLAYGVWGYLHSVFQIGNGTFEDDVLYQVLDWKDDPKTSLILTVVIVLVVAPLMYLLVWSLSLVSSTGCCDGGRRRTMTLASDKSSMARRGDGKDYQSIPGNEV